MANIKLLLGTTEITMHTIKYQFLNTGIKTKSLLQFGKKCKNNSVNQPIRKLKQWTLNAFE